MSIAPVEILEEILECLMSDYPDPGRSNSDASTFLPRWYLTPLLRVCKFWYALFQPHLYRSISTGGAFPTRFTATGVRLRSRSGRRVAVDLLATLLSNPRLAAMVRKLRLGIDKNLHDHKTEKWARLNTRILQRCPNVKEVVICGFYLSDDDTMFDVLKRKSLTSFCLRSRSHNTARASRIINPQVLYATMKCWPELRSIDVEFYWLPTDRAPFTYETSQAYNCCPDLHEISLTRYALWEEDFRTLRAICNSVTTLNVWIPDSRSTYHGAAALGALRECLRAWTSSLECISLTVRVGCQYPCLFTELSTLSRLEELHISCEDMEGDMLGSPQQIARKDCYRVPEDYLDVLTNDLENPEKFPALRRFAAWFSTQTPRLEEAFRGRRIQLRDEGDFKLAPSAFLP